MISTHPDVINLIDVIDAFPTVSAVCLIKGRKEFVPNIMVDWARQDYPLSRREMILATEDGESYGDLIPTDQNVRITSSCSLPIGAKRNFANSAAMGEIIITWDSDDRHRPQRISTQVSQLQSSGKAVVGYHQFIAGPVNGSEARWIYDGQEGYSCGAGLAYKRSWWMANPFLDLMIGEDNMFVSVANRHHQLATFPAGDNLLVGVHPGNSDVKRVQSAPWKVLV